MRFVRAGRSAPPDDERCRREARRELLHPVVADQPLGLTIHLVDAEPTQGVRELEPHEGSEDEHRDHPHQQQAFYKSASLTRR